MKTNLKEKLVLLLLLASIQGFAITTYFSTARFYSPTDGPFVETYLTVLGKTTSFKKNANNLYQAGAEIAWIFYQNDKIVAANKYICNSVEVNDSLLKPDFTDVQRFLLPPGEYDVELIVADKYFIDKKYNSKSKLIIEKPVDSLFFSDIEFVESAVKTDVASILNKGGVEINPFQATFFPDGFDKLLFYGEMYNSAKILGENEKFVFTYSIVDFNTNKVMADFSNFTKQSANIANSFLGELNIENLPSGNYNLVVEAHNKLNEIKATQKTFFQRLKKAEKDTVNPNKNIEEFANGGNGNFEKKIVDIDSLVYYLRTIRPISTRVETDVAARLIKAKDKVIMQNFLHTFWEKRSAINPEAAFHKYNGKVNEVNSMFSTSSIKGFRTDRGRVYLQYGAPDQRGRYENEPSNFPYEIWQYYTINKVRNRKFIFYNPSLATNGYRLLHSDAIGETRNDNWRVELDSRSLQGQKSKQNLDKTETDDYMGNQSNDNFSNPR